MKRDVVEVFRDRSGMWRWTRRDAYNRQVVAVCGEGYARRDHAAAMARKINRRARIEATA